MNITPIFGTSMALKGRYRMQRINANSGEIMQSSSWMNNLITNAGKQMYIGRGDWAPLYCGVGTGNSTPDASNTALDHLLYRTTAADAESAPNVFTDSGGTLKSTFRFRFNPGQAVGNISELGMYLADYEQILFSRALVRDSQDNPTTITVLSDEYLDVYWEFTLQVAGRATGTFPLYNKDGTTSTIDWVIKPAASAYWNARSDRNLAIPRIGYYGHDTYLYNNVTAEPGHQDAVPLGHGNTHSPNNGGAWPYVDGSYYRDYEYRWLLDRANISGINCFRLYIYLGHLWLYLPNHSFEKTNMDKLTLRFRLSIA